MKKKEAINDLIVDILEIYDLAAEKKSGIVVTEKNRRNYPIILKEDTVDYSELEKLIDRFSKKFLVISLEGFSRGATELADEIGVDLWDKKKLEKEIGKAVLSEVGIKNKLDLNKPKEITLLERKNEIEESFSNSSLLKESKSSQKTINSTNKEKYFALNISKDEARKKSKLRNPNIHLLKLEPYFEIKYSCDSKFEYNEQSYEIKENGTCYIDAINGKIADFEIKSKTKDINVNNISIDKKEKEINKKEAKKIATKKLSQELAIEKNRGENRRESIIFEKKELKPDKEDIELENRGIIYRPIWDIRNKEKSTRIDGVEGKVLSGSTEEGVEFL